MMEKEKWRVPRHKSWQPSVRKTAAGIVAVAMLATGIGAYAAGDGDHNEGTGGSNVPTSIMWRYKDDGSGSWGPATDPQSVVNAFNAAGVTIKGNGMQAIRDTLERARVKCATGFIARHPNQGDGECRVVGVGAAVYANDKSYDDTIIWSGRQQWETTYNNLVKPYGYNYGGTRPYLTSTPFDDDPSRSVDSIAYSLMPDTSGTDKKNLIIIVLDKYQPAPATYQLNLETAASGFTQAGYTGAVSDKIITRSNTNIRENVSGDSWLTWRGVDGTTNRIKKQWTASNNDSTTVTVNKEDMSANWKYWPLGKYWFDTYAAKQGKMSGDIGHWGENMASESWSVTQLTPPVKTLTNSAGKTVEGGSLPSGSVYTAHITARSEGSKHFWLYDTIDTTTARVVIGGAEQDDFNQITVTNSAGQKVNADISVDDSQTGKRIVKARVDNPTVDTYSLNVPQAFTPTGEDYTVRDNSRACYTGDGQLCQDGDSREVDKVTPNPNKVWVLDTDS